MTVRNDGLRKRVAAMAAAVDYSVWNRPNLRHMNALLDAVERGLPWSASGRRPSPEEVRAAYRATGREPPRERTEAGEDWEEDAGEVLL